jgi:hypothetical protein
MLPTRYANCFHNSRINTQAYNTASTNMLAWTYQYHESSTDRDQRGFHGILHPLMLVHDFSVPLLMSRKGLQQLTSIVYFES